MSDFIPTPTVGEIVIEEFMKPLNISPVMLAEKIDLPENYICELLDGHVQVTPELSKKIADFFGMSPLFFFRLQTDINNRNHQKTQTVMSPYPAKKSIYRKTIAG